MGSPDGFSKRQTIWMGSSIERTARRLHEGVSESNVSQGTFSSSLPFKLRLSNLILPLALFQVLNAGHMVPMDIPDVSLDMLRNLVFGNSFRDYEQILARSTEEGNGCAVCPQPTTCDECPTCEPLAEGEDEKRPSQTSPTSKEEHPPMTITLPFLNLEMWAGIFAAVLTSVFCLCWICSCRRQTKRKPATRYDIELQTKESSSYTDEPQEYGEFS